MVLHTWIVTVVVTIILTATTHAQEGPMWMYVGTQSGPRSEGIYVMRFDPATGSLSKPVLAAKANRAGFLAFHPNRRFLYAVNEVADAQGTKSGAVSAYAIDAATGKLTELNSEPSGGKGPCFVAIDHTGKNALVANYGDGVISVIPIAADGKLKPPSAVVQHEGPPGGKGPNEKRQAGPHAHSFNVDPGNRFALAADLGTDKVMIYRFDADSGKITPNDPPFAQVAPGAGPRHLAFGPGKNGKFAYVINEMGNTVTVFAWDAQRGAMSEVQTIGTLPPDFTGSNTTAEVLVHPSGKFLYGSNRGHDSIAIFTIDPSTGKLQAHGHTKTGGKTPRNFGIDPTGKFLVAANQQSDNIVVFRIDESTGTLTATGTTAEVGTPTCVRFLKLD